MQQRCHAALVLGVEVRAVLYQDLHDILMTFPGGSVQRCDAGIVRLVDVRGRSENFEQQLRFALAGQFHERFDGRVDIGTAGLGWRLF